MSRLGSADATNRVPRIVTVEAAVARGAGVAPVHFATFAAERDLARVLRWQGAAFQWEQGGKRDWYSQITWASGHDRYRSFDVRVTSREYCHYFQRRFQVLPQIGCG